MNQETLNIVWLKRDLRLQDHEPFTMSDMEQTFCVVTIGVDYPLPIVDLKASAKIARDKIWRHKKHPAVTAEKNRILATHVNKNL